MEQKHLLSCRFLSDSFTSVPVCAHWHTFGAQARFPRESVEITGDSSAYTRVGDEVGKTTFFFCPECGSTVRYCAEDQPNLVAIPVGAFADAEFPGPSFSGYEERMRPWVRMPLDMEHMA